MFKIFASLVVVAALALIHPRTAHAQFAVIDVASLGQLVQEYETLQQQLTTLRGQLTQAQASYAAITGSRGMQNLLSGTPRNYLPADWSQLNGVMTGSSGAYGTLAGQVTSLTTANAVLTPSQISIFSSGDQAQLQAMRQAAALRQVTARTALANSSDRFSSLQQLIGAIGTATDEKGALDLNARISAELGMLANEHTKLSMLEEVQHADEQARHQQLQEQAIADQGSLRRLPALGL
jgi:type IV secretion system protein VirB5